MTHLSLGLWTLAWIAQAAVDPATVAGDIRNACATHQLSACDRAIAAAESVPPDRAGDVASALLEVAHTDRESTVRLAAYVQLERIRPDARLMVEHATLLDQDALPYRHSDSEQQKDSEAILLRAVELARGDARILIALGEHYLRWYKAQQAIDAFVRALAAAPADATAREMFEIAVETAGEWHRLVTPAPAVDSAAALQQLRLCTELTALAALRACTVARTLGLSTRLEARARTFFAAAMPAAALHWREVADFDREMEQQLRTAIKLAPESLVARALLAARLAEGKPEEAVSLYGDLGPRLRTWPEGLLKQARALLALKRYDDARAVFTAAIAASPEDADAYVGMAEALRGAGTEASGIARAYEQVLERDASLASAWWALDEAYRQLGREDLRDAAAMAARPWLVVPHERESLASTLWNLGRVEEAEALSREILGASADAGTASPNTSSNGARILADLGKNEDAVSTYRRHIAANGGERQADVFELETFGHILEEAGQLPEALRIYRLAARRGAIGCGAEVSVAQLLLRLRRAGEAIAALDRARRIQADCPGANESMVHALALAGRTEESEKRAREALQPYHDAVRTKPDSLADRFALLVALKQAGRTADRREALRAALERWPGETALLNLQADDLAEQGEFARAAEVYARIHRLDPRYMARHRTAGRAWKQSAARAGLPVPSFALPPPVALPFTPASAAPARPRLDIPTALLLTFDKGTIALGPDANGRLTLTRATASIVPRSDGFWSVGVSSSMFGTRLGARPARPRRPVRQQQEPEPRDEQGMCETGTLRFIGPRYVSFTQVDDGACGERDTGNPRDVVIPFDQAVRQRGESVPIEKVLGERAAAALARAVRVDPSLGWVMEDIPETPPDDGARRWRVVRRQGRWRVQGLAEGFRFDRVPEDAVTLPAELVGYDALPGWGTIKELFPDAVDAFISPWNNIVVILTPTRLHVMQPAEAGLQRLTSFRVEANQVIAVNWARGAAAARWVSLIASQR